MKNYYEILEVSPNASIEVIENSYNILDKKFGSESIKGTIDEEERRRRVREINEAYAVLSNEFLKEQYDKELQKLNEDNKLDNKSDIEYIRENDEKDINKKEIKQQEKTKDENVNKVGSLYSIIKICKDIFSHIPNFKKVKEMTRNDYISIGLTIVIMIVFLIILWFIPFTKPFINSIIGVF